MSFDTFSNKLSLVKENTLKGLGCRGYSAPLNVQIYERVSGCNSPLNRNSCFISRRAAEHWAVTERRCGHVLFCVPRVLLSDWGALSFSVARTHTRTHSAALALCRCNHADSFIPFKSNLNNYVIDLKSLSSHGSAQQRLMLLLLFWP